ncbi:MAG: M48 family metalloprotease [Maricaulaceae bacterium]
MTHPKRWLAGALAVGVAVLTAAPAHAQGLIRDTEIEAVVAEWSEPILDAAGLEVDAVDIHIVGDNSLNAFVAAGQRMFFNTGIILASETPNELKGVIAHEAGHIAGGHLARQADNIRSARAPTFIALLLGAAAIAAGAPDAGASLIAGSQQFGALNFLRHNRVQEASADQSAMNYLEATGQSGEGLVAFFDRFRYQELFSNQRRFEYFRTHPLSSDRIEAMRGRVDSSPYRDAKDPEYQYHQLEMMKAKIQGFLEPPGQTFFKYKASDGSQPSRYARSIAHFKLGQMDEALDLVESLIAEEPENGYFYELKGEMLIESGRAPEAIAPLEQAVAYLPRADITRTLLGQAMIDERTDGRIHDGVEQLQAAVAIDPGNSGAWYHLARAYSKLDKIAYAEYATAESKYAAGDPFGARSFAKRALGKLPPGAPAWYRANEIVTSIESDPRFQEAVRRGGGRPRQSRFRHEDKRAFALGGEASSG